MSRYAKIFSKGIRNEENNARQSLEKEPQNEEGSVVEVKTEPIVGCEPVAIKTEQFQFHFPGRNELTPSRQDPRPDLESDHKLWVQLLTTAFNLSEEKYQEIYGVLHGIRCLGAKLQVFYKKSFYGKVELAPVQDRFKLLPGEIPAAEWEEIKRKWLDLVRDDLIFVLKMTVGTTYRDLSIPEPEIVEQKEGEENR